jgi:hypothetical protein
MSLRVEGDNETGGSGHHMGQARSKTVDAAKPLKQVIQSQGRALLLEDEKIVDSLRGIVSRFSADPISRQDMLQECLLCLWLAECENPGRTVSWYLQRCRFHVQHWLVLGRSLDSPKRANTANRIIIDGNEEEPALAEHHTNGEVLDTVCVRDLITTLAKRLKPNERFVLGGLAAGLTLREVAFKTKLSYPTALKYRRKIAALTLKLGIINGPRQQSRPRRTRKGRGRG